MNLFLLDKVIILFFKKLMTDPVVQFSVIAAIGAFVNGMYPDSSKNSKENKK